MIDLTILVTIAVLALAMTIYAASQWRGDRYLCDTCKYNSDELCQKPERPRAVECTAFSQK